MKELPAAQVYADEYRFFPWGQTIERVLAEVVRRVPKGGMVLDVMCGPGYLLNKLEQARPDLKLFGIDIDRQYIEYARQQNSHAQYWVEDVRKGLRSGEFDCVLCTGSLHHLKPDEQFTLLQEMAATSVCGMRIVADPCISSYANETERRLGAAKLGYEYLRAALRWDNLPEEIVKAALDILTNDVLYDGEYKTSKAHLMEMFAVHFKNIQVEKVWPRRKSDYGDYIFYLTPK